MTRRELVAGLDRLDLDLRVMLDALGANLPAETLAVMFMDGRLDLDGYCRLRGLDERALVAA